MTTKTSTMIVFVLLASPAFAAATGRIVGPKGAPVSGAEVCESVEGAPDRCVTADAQGVYRMDAPTRARLLVRAKGFIPKFVDAAPLGAPVQLERAASLLVVVIDADTKTPVASGRVMLDSPSGVRIGDFVPFNTSGVRISTLEPGDVFVRVDASGYAPSGPVPVSLVSGVERSVTVPLKKAAVPPR